MPKPRPDWHPEDIKAALRKRGVTLTALSVKHGWAKGTAAVVLRRPAASVQAAIAAVIGKPPQAIWPSRYNADGTPRRRNQRRGETPAAQRQIREAA